MRDEKEGEGDWLSLFFKCVIIEMRDENRG